MTWLREIAWSVTADLFCSPASDHLATFNPLMHTVAICGVDFVEVKSWQRTSGSCEVIKVGTLRSYDTEKRRKSGEGNRSRMCTRLQKSWSTMPALDRLHRWMDWDEDQWSGYSSGRSWSLERDTTRRQPFLWRKALNDDDVAIWVLLQSILCQTGLSRHL